MMGKQAHRPFDAKVEPETKPYERVAFDLWGPARVQMTGGKTLMLVPMDHAGANCKAWYLVHKTKENTLACLESFDARIKTQLRMRVKCVRTDGGREFENELWNAYCTK